MPTKPKLSRAAAGLLAGLGLLAGCAKPAPEFENLVLVMVDTLRSDHLPSYGYGRDTARLLGELAREGVQVQGLAASSWNKASIGTLLTGLHPQRHQAITRADSLPSTVAYLPALLDGAGFTTAAYVGNRNAGKHFGFDRGFDHFYQFRPAAKVDGRKVTERSLALAAKLQKPFFLYVHYVDPHDPYRPRKAWFGAKPGAEVVQPLSLAATGQPPTAEQLAALRDAYDGEIRELDDDLRRLVQGLGDKGLLEKTLVVVTSDHGEEFGEHGGLTHGSTLYEEMVRVPLILWSRQGLEPRTSAARFHQVDFAPSLLAALGVVPPKGDPPPFDGADRWQTLVSGTLPAAEPAFFHLDLDRKAMLALRRGDQKLVHGADAPHDRLFDLAADPGERQATGEGPAVAGLRQELLRHHNALGIAAAKREVKSLGEEDRKGLAALGYLALDTPEKELAHRRMPRKLDRDAGFAAKTNAPP